MSPTSSTAFLQRFMPIMLQPVVNAPPPCISNGSFSSRLRLNKTGIAASDPVAALCSVAPNLQSYQPLHLVSNPMTTVVALRDATPAILVTTNAIQHAVPTHLLPNPAIDDADHVDEQTTNTPPIQTVAGTHWFASEWHLFAF